MDKKSLLNDRLNLLVGFIAFVVVLIFIAGVLWVISRVILKLDLKLDVDNEIAAAILTASIAGILSTGAIVYQKYIEHKQKIELELREKKILVYKEFLEFWFHALESAKLKKSVSEKEMTDFIFKFTPKLMSWGSDEVVHLYSRFKQRFSNIDTDKKN